jgi:hypothetical protein
MFDLPLEQMIFNHARAFNRSSLIIHNNGGLECTVAMVTNNALANELYLKCLIIMETGDRVLFEHDLRKLFVQLAGDTKTDIARRFNRDYAAKQALALINNPEFAEMVKRGPKNFDEALDSGARAFIDWRYIYEGDSFGKPYALLELPNILEQLILERKPSWDNFKLSATRLDGPQPTAPIHKIRELGAWGVPHLPDDGR